MPPTRAERRPRVRDQRGRLKRRSADVLGSLLSLREERQREAFAYDDLWAKARGFRDDLSKLANQGWAYAQASILASQWTELTRDEHLVGYQSTQAQAGEYLIWRSSMESLK